MSSNHIRTLVLGASAGLLAACNTANSHIGDEDPAFGEALKYDEAIQTVNPAPVYPASAAQPGDSGVKAQNALKRYRTDAVKPVEATQTTAGTSSSGSAPH